MKSWIVVVGSALVLLVLAYQLFPGAVYALAMRAERTLAGLVTQRLVLEDGIEIVYSDREGDGVPLVLLHGFTADRDHWTRVARFTEPGLRVIAPDLPGFGMSTRDAALDYSIAAQLGRFEAFIKAIGLERFHLGGSSMGGNIAALYAARHPGRVLSLWLLAPAGVETGELSDMERALRAGEPHPLIPASRREFEATLDFVFVDRPFLPGALRRHLSRVAVERRVLREQIFAELIDSAQNRWRTPLNEVAASLAMPTLIVWGQEDRVLHPAGAEALAGLLPDARARVLPDVGHLPMLEVPRRTGAIHAQFLRTTEKGR